MEILLKERTFLLERFKWVLRGGKKVHALKDRWIPGIGKLINMPTRFGLSQVNIPTSVADFVTFNPENEQLEWDLENLRIYCVNHIVQSIQNIPRQGPDIPCWDQRKAGSCSARDIYKTIQPFPTCPHLPRKKLWSLCLPLKLKFFE